MRARFWTVTAAILIAISCVLADEAQREKAKQFPIENGRLVLPGPIVFKADRDVIEPESEASL